MSGRLLCRLGLHRWGSKRTETEHHNRSHRVVLVQRCDREGCGRRRYVGALTTWLGETSGMARSERRRLAARATGSRTIGS